MNRYLGAFVFAAATMASAAEHPPVAGQVTFLYFNDLDKANHFYSKVLGLETAFDLDWVNIYKLSPTSSVGLVNASGGAHKPSGDKPVMVSMVVVVYYIESRRFLIRDSPRPATTYEQKTGGADGVKGA